MQAFIEHFGWDRVHTSNWAEAIIGLKSGNLSVKLKDKNKQDIHDASVTAFYINIVLESFTLPTRRFWVTWSGVHELETWRRSESIVLESSLVPTEELMSLLFPIDNGCFTLFADKKQGLGDICDKCPRQMSCVASHGGK